MVKEGAPVFMKIAGVAFLLLLTILLYYTAKKRWHKVAGVIGILVLAGVFAFFASGISKEMALKPKILDTPEPKFVNYDIKDGHFTVIDANPHIIKEIDVPVSYTHLTLPTN